ncbi:kinesin-like protein KIN-14T isoform X2 [Cynara cardunculus var. scolymus]|uniref:kinesin-like protein KIN-14T isoform X2 n=1 Tax=Cynara cardunculus var. scolymus TaxID=59895 RepID=UPI000D62E328|nr:kinesin-like protein KIN-14T isoform X2 [Cynara cardunculus var. scolymus]
MKKMKDTKKSFKSLSQTIHSLLGFKNETTSTWANTVCDIIKSLPSTADYENDCDDSVNDHDHDDDLDAFLISKIHGELATLNEEISELSAQRRQVLNEFLQLKGNIRVFCRIRPTIDGEKFSRLKPVVPVDSNGVLLNFAEKKTKLYNFDTVFHPASSQDEVFLEIEPVIKSALDGYNVCILAYGQTGTGKTFTMEGTPDCPGVVPRTMEELFKQAADGNHTYLFSFSMLEIYLGHLKDLLIPQARKSTDPMPPCLSIQTDPNGGIVIDNLVSIQVSNFNHAISLYRLGSQLRSTASTNSNKASSRSHCMIRISMTCSDATARRKITNKIWMVDLGGSERVLKTKAWGRRFEEGKAINLSLSALGDVINALQRKNSHIPYRNSKLTQVLKDSLGEDSKTLMLVHVSPKEEDLCETVCSLNFALRLRSIHLGKTEANEARAMREGAMTNLQREMQKIEDIRDKLRKEVKKLNQKLESLTKTSSGSNAKLDGFLLSLNVSQPNADEISAMPPKSKMPSFMKPTICSTRKSGTGHQTSYKKDIKPARRKKLPLSRAESVSFPIKGMTESYSGSSISRASCLTGLNEINLADNDTEYSQDMSQCSFRTGIGKQRSSSKNSTDRSVHSSLSEDAEFSSTSVSDSNHLLYLQEHKTNSSSHAHQNKRVLSIPTPVKKSKATEKMRKGKLTGREMTDYKFTKTVSEKPRSLLRADVRFAGKASRSDYNSSIPSTGSTKLSTGVDDSSIEGDIHYQIMPCDSISDTSHQDDYVNGVDGTVISQVFTHEKGYSDAYKLKDELPTNVSTSDADSSAIGLAQVSEVSFSRSELKSPSEKVPTGMGGNHEEQCTHSQYSVPGKKSWLYEVRTPKFSAIDNFVPKDLTKLSSQTHANAQTRA